MKAFIEYLIGFLVVICSAIMGWFLADLILIIIKEKPKPELKISWFNDGVYYTTNTVSDDERNKTLPEQSFYFYTKQVIHTNKTTQFYFPRGDRQIELGSREDGVVVWRYPP